MSTTTEINQEELRDRETILKLNDAELDFVASQTGIKDREQLIAHLLEVKKELYKTYPAPYTSTFHWVKLAIIEHPAYPELVRIGRERPGALLLDVGCCVGNAIRKFIADGYPAEQIIGTDVVPGFWDVGHKIFKSSPETFPTKFLAGDVLDPAFLAPPAAVADSNTRATSNVDIAALTSLTPLRGHLSVIHASHVIHLFSEEDQRGVAQKLGSLLLPEPGSLILGSQITNTKEAAGGYLYFEPVGENAHRARLWCNSPESWKAVWEEIYGADRVEVKTTVIKWERKDMKEGFGNVMETMDWSVRLL